MQHYSSSSEQSIASDEERRSQYMRLNGTYDLIKMIGEGSTCKVWLARSVGNPKMKFAIKLLFSKPSTHSEPERGQEVEWLRLCMRTHTADNGQRRNISACSLLKQAKELCQLLWQRSAR